MAFLGEIWGFFEYYLEIWCFIGKNWLFFVNLPIFQVLGVQRGKAGIMHIERVYFFRINAKDLRFLQFAGPDLALIEKSFTIVICVIP